MTLGLILFVLGVMFVVSLGAIFPEVDDPDQMTDEQLVTYWADLNETARSAPDDYRTNTRY